MLRYKVVPSGAEAVLTCNVVPSGAEAVLSGAEVGSCGVSQLCVSHVGLDVDQCKQRVM